MIRMSDSVSVACFRNSRPQAPLLAAYWYNPAGQSETAWLWFLSDEMTPEDALQLLTGIQAIGPDSSQSQEKSPKHS